MKTYQIALMYEDKVTECYKVIAEDMRTVMINILRHAYGRPNTIAALSDVHIVVEDKDA